MYVCMYSCMYVYFIRIEYVCLPALVPILIGGNRYIYTCKVEYVYMYLCMYSCMYVYMYAHRVCLSTGPGPYTHWGQQVYIYVE
jgi:hypothetical protein